MKTKSISLKGIYICFFYCVILSFKLSSQVTNTDSLIGLLQTSQFQKGEVRIDLLNNISHKLLRLEPEQSQKYSREALQLSRGIDYPKGETRALYLQGSYQYMLGENLTAVERIKAALQIAKEIDSDYHKAAAYNGLAICYTGMNNKEEGLKNMYKALEAAERTEDDLVTTSILANLGWFHMREKNYDIAATHYLRLVELAEENQNNQMLIINYTSLGILYRQTGEYTKALSYLGKTVEFCKKTGDRDMEAYSYIYSGEVYTETNENQKAEEDFRKAKSIFEKIGSEIRLLHLYASLSVFYAKNKRYREAKETAKRGLNLSDKLKNDEYQPLLYESLINSNADLRDFQSAFQWQQEFISWKDTIEAEKKDQKILDLEKQFQWEQMKSENELLKIAKKQQHTQLKSQKQVFWIVAAFIFFGLLFIRSLNSKNKALKLANKEVVKSSQVKQDFLSTMSHEIRTPLNAVIGFTELLSMEEPRADQEEYVSGLQSSSRHLLALINNILDFSKIEAKKVELEEIPFDLGKQLSAMIKTFQISNKNEHLNIRLNTNVELEQQIIGDPTRLYQVLSNLLSNAIKFTPEGSVNLEVKALNRTKQAIQLEFAVIDTGVGIAPEKQELIFEDFTQESTTTTREFGGTGLGLSICKELIEMMGGKILLESELGKGSVFKFKLSFIFSDIEASKSNSRAKFIAERGNLKGKRILLVEDNFFNQRIASTLLQKRGAEITLANNGKEALELVKQHYFQLILMDLHMPIMDGFEAVAEIKKLSSPKNKIPIVVLTATSDDEILNYPILENFDIVQKPFDQNQFVSVIEKNLD